MDSTKLGSPCGPQSDDHLHKPESHQQSHCYLVAGQKHFSRFLENHSIANIVFQPFQILGGLDPSRVTIERWQHQYLIVNPIQSNPIDLTLTDVLRMPTLNLKLDIGVDVGVGVKQSIDDNFATV